MFALPISKPRFKIIIFLIKIVLKWSYFCKKMQNFRALGAPPPNPRASGGWELCPQTPSLRQTPKQPSELRPQTPKQPSELRPQTPKQPPHCEFLATRLTATLLSFSLNTLSNLSFTDSSNTVTKGKQMAEVFFVLSSCSFLRVRNNVAE